MPHVETSLGRLAYEVTGDGPDVLFLHGIPGSSGIWDGVIAALPGVRAIAVDLLGFGGSARVAGIDALHAAGQSAALAEAIKSLGLHDVTVVGHDFGAPVSIRLAARAPERVRRLALLSGNVFPDTPIPFPLSLVPMPVVGPLAASLLFSGASLGMMLRSGVGTPKVILDCSVYLGDTGQQEAIATIFRESLRQLAPLYAPVLAELRALTIPKAVAWGTRDPFFPIAQGQRVADAADVPLHRFKDAGHFLPAERPAEVAALIRMLLDEG